VTAELPWEPRGAELSTDGLYRYRLWRHWHPDGDRVAWVMLNPSTADAVADDATIRKITGFSQRWGFAGLEVVNLYAYRATDPRVLRQLDDPVGPDNVATVDRVLDAATLIVAAWGAGAPLDAGWAIVGGRDLHCLGVTKDGSPRHPLYVRNDTVTERFVFPAGMEEVARERLA
jgi:hypothetical protein